MSDGAILAAIGGILGTMQALSTAWLHFQTNKNACDGAKCVDTMTKALRITTGRIAGIDEEREDDLP